VLDSEAQLRRLLLLKLGANSHCTTHLKLKSQLAPRTHPALLRSVRLSVVTMHVAQLQKHSRDVIGCHCVRSGELGGMRGKRRDNLVVKCHRGIVQQTLSRRVVVMVVVVVVV
jgi:hypothetical protein